MSASSLRVYSLSIHNDEPKLSYVSFFGDVHTFSKKLKDVIIFRSIRRFSLLLLSFYGKIRVMKLSTVSKFAVD